MDIGSLRLVARNKFRNVINAFSGIDWQRKLDDEVLRAFYTFPVQHLLREFKRR